MQVSYELHAQSKGGWHIERVLSGGTKEAALDEARHLYAEPGVTGVKVVCEKYNPETNDSSEMVVYDTTKGIGEKVEVKQQPAAQPAAQASGQAAASRTTTGGASASASAKNRAAAKKQGSSLTGIAVLSVIAVTAIAVLGILVTRGAEVLGSL
jgi:hypothetical protein